jgi:hypothetical protein
MYPWPFALNIAMDYLMRTGHREIPGSAGGGGACDRGRVALGGQEPTAAFQPGNSGRGTEGRFTEERFR